jgi:hypothetical protein
MKGEWRSIGVLLTMVVVGAGCSKDSGAAGEASAGSSGITATGNAGTDSSGAADETAGAVKLDVGGGGTGNSGGDCQPGGGNGGSNDSYDFSIIWIANSPEGTVSKIDTEAAMEVARYASGPDEPDPSRTSVNLLGDVAVANRAGSVTKIAARLENCIDKNTNGTIETSQGPDDVLAWDEDECVLWHHEVGYDRAYAEGANVGGPRAIAWDGYASQGCETPNLWVGWRNQPEEEVLIRRLDGRTGDLIGEVTVPDWEGNWGHGTYGGASDADGAFWGLGTLGTLLRVDPQTLDVERWDNPTQDVVYGIALDADGTPWLAGYNGNLWKFDRGSETFVDMGGTNGGPSRMRGLAIDSEGFAWIAGNDHCALIKYDTINETLVDGDILLEDCETPVGVSIDAKGRVWVVDRNAELAYRVDRNDFSAVTVAGLVGPYTYSDMTGAGLNLVVNPPG